jgi:hypothetical protein
MANTGGGRIVIGVVQRSDKSLDPVGMPALADKADIVNGIKNFLPNVLHSTMVTILDFHFEESEYAKLVGKSFQVMFINYEPGHIPFAALRDGASIRAAAIYVQREGLTEEANYDDLQRLLNARIETGHSTSKELDLKGHLLLDQLRALMAEIPKYRQDWGRLVQGRGGLCIGLLVVATKPELPERGLRRVYPTNSRIKEKTDRARARCSSSQSRSGICGAMITPDRCQHLALKSRTDCLDPPYQAAFPTGADWKVPNVPGLCIRSDAADPHLPFSTDPLTPKRGSD